MGGTVLFCVLGKHRKKETNNTQILKYIDSHECNKNDTRNKVQLTYNIFEFILGGLISLKNWIFI